MKVPWRKVRIQNGDHLSLAEGWQLLIGWTVGGQGQNFLFFAGTVN